MLRPGYQRLLEDMRAGRFDLVLAEGLDRLSRDQEHTAALFKQLSFAGVRLVTLAEGEVGELHVGLKGTMNALYLKDLAQKTHRGLRGSRSGGPLGRRALLRLCGGAGAHRAPRPAGAGCCASSQPRPRWCAGSSGVRRGPLGQGDRPGPEPGRHRRPRGRRLGRRARSRGNAARGNGILNNELYVGRRVWNRQRFVKDPAPAGASRGSRTAGSWW